VAQLLFLSSDPAGLISIDSRRWAWLQTASAKLFGFTPLSLLLPEAIAGVIAVAALYLIVQKRSHVRRDREAAHARRLPGVRAVCAITTWTRC